MNDNSTSETLIYKDYIIRENNVEIIFHKDFVWNYNAESLPIVKFLLTNCRDLERVKFDHIDFYNDGVIVDIRHEKQNAIFETTDMGDVKVKIVCDKVIKEEQEYNKQDYVDLIQEILKQRDKEFDTTATLNKRTEDSKHFLNRELDIVERKREQAVWLTEDKKQFLEGQKSILQKVIETIEKFDKTDI